jgi:sulfate adenylyltransferase (ADP) / ATP adenylyltransferase
MSGSVVPSLSSVSSILTKVARQYESALNTNSIFFYPSKITILSQDVEGSSKSTTIPWTIRCVPALLDKAKEKHQQNSETTSAKASDLTKDAKKQQNPSDVFAPPYHPDLLVEELPKHTILLNKFCVVPKHFLLVTREFASQNVPPSPDTLTIAYRILQSHEALSAQRHDDVAHDKELLAFYNCGKVSGASQPHQHMQFAELGAEGKQEESINSSLANVAIPVEQLLSRIPQDGREDEVYALPLPYQHFVSIIRQPPTDNAEKLQDYLGMKLLSLLDAQFQARLAAYDAQKDKGASTDDHRSAPSWNLLMTTRAMHLIPRKKEEFDGLRDRVNQEGKEHKEDGVDLVGSLSVNSLGYAGHLLVKSLKELEYLQTHPGGVIDVLRQTGTPPVEDVTTATHHEN